MAQRSPVRTELQLDRLRPRNAPFDVPVAIAPGMIVRVSPHGKKSFRWDRGRGHKPRIITYGHYPSMGLEEAAREHRRAKQRHEDGVSIVSGATPTTVRELGEAFYNERIKPHRRRPENVRRTLDNDILPRLGRLKLRSVTAPAVRSLIRDVIDRDAPAQAGKVLAHTKQMFNYGVSIGAMEANPAQTLTLSLFGVSETVRDRILNDSEIRQLHEALDKHKRLSLQIKIALKLLLLTGLRSGELRQARWEDYDAEAATLMIPVEHQKLSPKQAKKAKPFVCTLPRQAIGLIKELEGLDPVWLFPGKLRSEAETSQPLSDKALGRAVRRLVTKPDPKREPVLPIPSFSPHDLRRTLRSGLSRLKVAPHIAERCLNHSLGGIIDVYDHHDYFEERKFALQQWANHVDAILQVGAGNVCQFRRGAA
ncbi:tyrosine-type recombinase/integrase [Pseudohaliea sp.]|uniref:tyrosine-type recombinase/integrase n=1 Tax=Pseudohaliea sp. TaxID=2740289 RepID=UPI0032F07ADF